MKTQFSPVLITLTGDQVDQLGCLDLQPEETVSIAFDDGPAGCGIYATARNEKIALFVALRIAALEAELAAAKRDAEPDLFWNDDDPEHPYSSIDEFLNYEWCQTGIEVGDTRTVQRAIRLANVTVRVTAVSEDGDIDYIVEEKDAAMAAQEKA